MRDYLEAIRKGVVVYDGGMGATLEQFDLTQEDYGGLEGKCHEVLVLNRPDVIEGVHTSMVEAGAEVVETDTFQGSRLKLDEWGLGEHTREIVKLFHLLVLGIIPGQVEHRLATHLFGNIAQEQTVVVAVPHVRRK